MATTRPVAESSRGACDADDVAKRHMAPPTATGVAVERSEGASHSRQSPDTARVASYHNTRPTATNNTDPLRVNSANTSPSPKPPRKCGFRSGTNCEDLTPAVVLRALINLESGHLSPAASGRRPPLPQGLIASRTRHVRSSEHTWVAVDRVSPASCASWRGALGVLRVFRSWQGHAVVAVAVYVVSGCLARVTS